MIETDKIMPKQTRNTVKNNLCPKCGSKMLPRRLWKKTQAGSTVEIEGIHIDQCTLCKFYILNNKK